MSSLLRWSNCTDNPCHACIIMLCQRRKMRAIHSPIHQSCLQAVRHCLKRKNQKYVVCPNDNRRGKRKDIWYLNTAISALSGRKQAPCLPLGFYQSLTKSICSLLFGLQNKSRVNLLSYPTVILNFCSRLFSLNSRPDTVAASFTGMSLSIKKMKVNCELLTTNYSD